VDNWRKNPLVFWVFALPPSLWLVAFFLVPLALIWVLSFGEKSGLIQVVVTWVPDNYLRALDPIYLQIFAKSFWFAGLTTFFCLVIGFLIAVAITFAPARRRAMLLLLVMLPFWTNLLIRTYALITVFRTKGMINHGLEFLWERSNALLELVGFGQLQLLGEQFQPLKMLYNNFAVVAGLVYVHLPFMVLPLYANIEKIDRSYIEASLDLGAGQWRTFFSVILPLTWHGVLSGVIIVFVPALGAFFIPDLLGGKIQLIGNVIERQFKSANDWPFGGALSFLLMYLTFGALALRAAVSGRKQGLEA